MLWSLVESYPIPRRTQQLSEVDPFPECEVETLGDGRFFYRAEPLDDPDEPVN
jgi:hypothetical protein